MQTLDSRLKEATATAFSVDANMADLDRQLGELILELNNAGRTHEAALLGGAKLNTRDSFYRQLASRIQDMETATRSQ